MIKLQIKIYSKEFNWVQQSDLYKLFQDCPTPILFLGAGASISSGIPVADKLVDEILKYGWRKRKNLEFNESIENSQEYFEWLEKLDWFDNTMPFFDLYPIAIKHILNVRKDRQNFFKEIINSKYKHSIGYISLVKILHLGLINTILTTNFDDYINRVQQKISKTLNIDHIKTSSDFEIISTAPKNPQIIYLHGSIDHLTDKNLEGEVIHLDKILVQRILPLIRDHPIIVVGYRGAENSIMNDLFLENRKFTRNFVNKIYWCILGNSINVEIPDQLCNLAKKVGSNFNFIPIRGFDSLLYKELYPQLDLDQFSEKFCGEINSMVTYDFEDVASKNPEEFNMKNFYIAVEDDFEDFDTSYHSKRDKGKVVFDHSNNDGIFTFGESDKKFETQWAINSDNVVYAYSVYKDI